jgi:hypothetical protein
MVDEPREPEPWNLPLKWVVISGVALWLLSGIALLIYLLGPKILP